MLLSFDIVLQLASRYRRKVYMDALRSFLPTLGYQLLIQTQDSAATLTPSGIARVANTFPFGATIANAVPSAFLSRVRGDRRIALIS